MKGNERMLHRVTGLAAVSALAAALLCAAAAQAQESANIFDPAN